MSPRRVREQPEREERREQREGEYPEPALAGYCRYPPVENHAALSLTYRYYPGYRPEGLFALASAPVVPARAAFATCRSILLLVLSYKVCAVLSTLDGSEPGAARVRSPGNLPGARYIRRDLALPCARSREAGSSLAPASPPRTVTLHVRSVFAPLRCWAACASVPPLPPLVIIGVPGPDELGVVFQRPLCQTDPRDAVA